MTFLPLFIMKGNEKLNPVRFGLALGAVCFIGTLALGVMASYFGYGLEIVNLMGTVYPGYDATMLGAFMGAGAGLVDGFVGGWLFAYFYNIV